jgi:hypothetical protein
MTNRNVQMKDSSHVFALEQDLRVLVTASTWGIRRAIRDLLAARGRSPRNP